MSRTRTLTRTIATLLLSAALLAVLCTLPTTAAPETRTLHPVEMWNTFGGGCVDDKKCGNVADCFNDLECIDKTGPIVCRGLGREDESQEVADQECNAAANPGDECFEDDTTVVCLKRWRCKWGEEGCVTDYSLPEQDYSAPELCENTCGGT